MAWGTNSFFFAETLRQLWLGLDLTSADYKVRIFNTTCPMGNTQQTTSFGTAALQITNAIFASTTWRGLSAPVTPAPDVSCTGEVDPDDDIANNHVYVDANDVTFSGMDTGQGLRGVVVYLSAATAHAICANKFSSIVNTSGETDVTVQWHTDGIFKNTYTKATP